MSLPAVLVLVAMTGMNQSLATTRPGLTRSRGGRGARGRANAEQAKPSAFLVLPAPAQRARTFSVGLPLRKPSVASSSGSQKKEARLVASRALSPRIPHSFSFVRFVLELFQLTSGRGINSGTSSNSPRLAVEPSMMTPKRSTRDAGPSIRRHGRRSTARPPRQSKGSERSRTRATGAWSPRHPG